MSEQSTSNQIDPELLSILRCPLTRSKLRQEGDFLIAEVGNLASSASLHVRSASSHCPN